MTTLAIVGAVLVTVLSAGRLTRLLTQDDFPPAAHIRAWWDGITNENSWSKLVHCHWCFGPWATLAVGGAGLLSDFHVAWWIVNGWLATSYVVSWVVHHDED